MTVTVVVIEDEPATRDLIVGYLTRRGNRVAGCGSLAEAGHALRDLQPDAVVSDVGLPDGNGADFSLQNLPHLPHVQWLIMSSQPDMLRRARARLDSFDADRVGLFVKPVPLRAFDDVVRRAARAATRIESSAAD